MPDRIRGIHHAQVTVGADEVEAARDFYVRVLGLVELRKPISLQSRGGFWCAAGDQQLHVGIEAGAPVGSKAHVAFLVDDADAWRRHLIGAGVAVTDSISIPGYRRFEFRDPGGNRVEIISTADG